MRAIQKDVFMLYHYIFYSSEKREFFVRNLIKFNEDTSLLSLMPRQSNIPLFARKYKNSFYKSFPLWLIILHFFSEKHKISFMTQKLFFVLVILSTFSYIDLAQFEIFFHSLSLLVLRVTCEVNFFCRLELPLEEVLQTRVNINQNLLQIIILDFEIFLAFCVNPI
jgi:hypothetical protein